MQNNDQNQTIAGFDIKYGEIETVPFPAKAKPKKNLGNVFVVTNGKFFSERYAVMNLHGELITDFVLKDDSFEKVKCFGALSILLPQGDGWSVCDFSGKPFSGNIYDDVVELKNSYLAVGKKNPQTRKTLYALADIYGNPKTSFEYIKIDAFSGGFAVAKQEQRVDIFGNNGKIAFSLDCGEMRSFYNGYAVFNKNGCWGAVDTTGRVTVQPRFAWLRDSEYDRFCYCDVANSTTADNMGVIDANGNIVLDVSKGLKDLTILNESTILHRVTYVREATQGNERILYRIPATGFVIKDKITDAKYLYIGEEREGLMAFVAYTQTSDPPLILNGQFTIGYMDSDFNTVFTLVDYKTKDSFDFGELQPCDSKHLSPFIDGLAVVQIQQGEVRAFRGSTFFCPQPYVIDKKGHRVTDAAAIQTRLSLHVSNSEHTTKDPIADTLRTKGLSVPFLFLRKTCKPLAKNFWSVQDVGEERFVFSSLETIFSRSETNDYGSGGYSCGLLGVNGANGLIGFVDENVDFVVKPIYKEASHFIDNAAWAMRDKQWFILKRSCEVLPTPGESSKVQYDADEKASIVEVKQGSWSFQTKGGSNYYSQNADSLLDAAEILKQIISIPPQTYYMVDTSDGTLGRDINGFFTEASIKTANLSIDNPGGVSESVQAQSLMGFGNMVNNQNSVAQQKNYGQYAKLILMMKCGRCSYESPIETVAGEMERQCYQCGTINQTRRGAISVYTAQGTVEV